jgi:hypothetical protein
MRGKGPIGRHQNSFATDPRESRDLHRGGIAEGDAVAVTEPSTGF